MRDPIQLFYFSPMGVIRRQSLKHVFVSLVGMVIGAFSTFLIYPHVREGYGLVQIMIQIGLLGLPLMSLGANTVAIRFFPKFQDKSLGHNGFLPVLLSLCILGFSLTGILAYVFWEPYMEQVAARAPLIREYLWMAFPMAFFYVVSTILFAYAANFKRIVVPSILLDFSQKLVLPILMVALWQGWIPLKLALWGMVIHSCSVTIGMILYLRWLGEWHWKPNFKFLTPALQKEMAAYIGFWTLGGFALLLATKSDIFMVGSMSATKAAGTFAIVATLAALIELPIKSLYSASVSSVARHLADHNYAELGKLYKSVSINLLVAGLLLFCGLWINIESLFHFFPASEVTEMSAAVWVFFFIGLAKLAEMSTGLNNYMIYYSPHYLYSLISLVLSAALTIVLNITLIPIYGITGAAISILCSVCFYNSFGVWFVWYKFGLFPFSKNTILAIGMAVLSFALARLIPFCNFDLLDILIRGGAFALLFAFLVIYFNVSPDLTELWLLVRQKLKRR
ncbi:MAG: oligosaccharide flippase family protein [Saprospiraceae bacterium]